MMKNRLFLIILFLQSVPSFGQSLHHLNRDLPCVNKQFNVYAHAVYDYNTFTNERTTRSEAYVKEAIARANVMFAPICISFKFCEMDTVHNYNYNLLGKFELEELSVLYEGYNRINLYLTTDIIIRPYKHSLSVGTIDRKLSGNIAINSINAFSQGLGLFFGLDYTFGGDRAELVDGSNCKTSGDKICDTPADPYNPLRTPAVYILEDDCLFFWKEKDLNGDYYQPDVGNIMSHYFECHCGFTYDQYMKMADSYFKSQKKYW